MGLSEAQVAIIPKATERIVCLAAAAVLLLAAAAGSKMLTGGVEQSAVLSPVTPQLTAAVEQAKKQPYVEWFMIPGWMAGEWTKDGDLTVVLTDLRTGSRTTPNEWVPNHLVRRFGHRKDRKGNIWWANIIPSEKDGETQGMADKFLIVARKMEKSTPQFVVTRTRFLITETSPNGREVLKQYQQEALNNYVPLPDGELENHSYNRVFDQSGRADRDGELVSKWRRTAPFENMKVRNGIDLELSLNQYLQSHGLAHLMTTEPAAAHRSPVPMPPAQAPANPWMPGQLPAAPGEQSPYRQAPYQQSPYQQAPAQQAPVQQAPEQQAPFPL